MHYYIDGYNLMFRVLAAGDSFRSEREEMIHDLYEMIELLNLDATIVFDAHSQEGLGSRSHYRSLEITFTDEGENADDYIINELKSNPTPRDETVVTSDGQLGRRARRLNAKTEKVEDFILSIRKRYRKKRQKIQNLAPPQEKTIKVLEDAEPLKIPDSPPEAKKTAEENTEFYLYHFEQEVKKTEKEKDQQRTKKGKKKPVKKQEPYEPDEDRWLRMFEENLEGQNRDEDDKSFDK